MKPEKEFDNIIKQKIDESEGAFPFDESNWQKASKLLDAERGTAAYLSNKRFLLIGALFFLLGTAGFFSYKLLNSSESNVAVVTSISKHESSTEKVTSPSSAYNHETENQAHIQTVENISSTSNSEIKQPEKNASSKKSSSGSMVGNSNPINKVHNAFTLSQQKFSKVNSLNVVHAKGNHSEEISSAMNSNNKDGVSDAGLSVTNAPNETEAAGSNMYENLFLNTKVSSLPKHPIDDEIKTTVYDFIRIYNEDYYKTKRRKTFYLDAEAGAAYMAGWDAPKGKDANGMNAYAGLNFGFHIKNKISASVGGQVYNISHIRQPFFTGSNLNYDFGSNGTYTTVITNSLLYFAVPVKINYALNKRNIIGFGINTGFLFNGKNTVETYNVSDAVKSNSQKTYTTGYYEGTNTLNVMLSAFYSRALTRRIKMNAELMYGVSDTYKNTETNRVQEKNMDIRLGLQYTLFDK